MVDQRFVGRHEGQIVLDCKCPKSGGLSTPVNGYWQGGPGWGRAVDESAFSPEDHAPNGSFFLATMSAERGRTIFMHKGERPNPGTVRGL
jgi:hypothetical protein